jgi:hypothetical protein
MTSFKKDIRPLFRDEDIEGMSGIIDLESYAEVKAKSGAIVDRITRAEDDPELMPPTANDGPWSADKIGLFKKWVEEGHPE